MDFRAREGSFEEAERRYADLVKRRETGEISDEDFREEQREIMARDPDGNWWARLGDNGEWFRRERGEWLPDTPPGYEKDRPANNNDLTSHNIDSNVKKSSGKLPVWIKVVGLVGVVLISSVLIWWALIPYLQAQSWFSDAGTEGESGVRQADAGSQDGTDFAAVFVHEATPENISANSTYINSPLTDGNPDAFIIVTQNWNPGGGGGRYNDHPVGVWYDSGREKWAIFNQDRAGMPEDASFNVAIRES